MQSALLVLQNHMPCFFLERDGRLMIRVAGEIYLTLLDCLIFWLFVRSSSRSLP